MTFWAIKQGVLKLELMVVCENKTAVPHYEKIERTKSASLLINGVE